MSKNMLIDSILLYCIILFVYFLFLNTALVLKIFMLVVLVLCFLTNLFNIKFIHGYTGKFKPMSDKFHNFICEKFFT